MSRLIVFLPGLGHSTDDINELYARLQCEPEAGELALQAFPSVSRALALGSMNRRCEALADEIDALESAERASSILLVGHSIGGVMVRYAYLYAREQGMAWAGKVERIVLLAAPNRGIRFDEFNWWQKAVVAVGSHLPIPFIGKDMLHGSLFISDLRIRWIREMTSPADAEQRQIPLVVQLLGKADNVVHEDDSDDIKTLPTGVQLPFPRATHHDILRITGVDEAEPGQRYRLLRKAILDDLDTSQRPALDGKEQAAGVERLIG